MVEGEDTLGGKSRCFTSTHTLLLFHSLTPTSRYRCLVGAMSPPQARNTPPLLFLLYAPAESPYLPPTPGSQLFLSSRSTSRFRTGYVWGVNPVSTVG